VRTAVFVFRNGYQPQFLHLRFTDAFRSQQRFKPVVVRRITETKFGNRIVTETAVGKIIHRPYALRQPQTFFKKFGRHFHNVILRGAFFDFFAVFMAQLRHPQPGLVRQLVHGIHKRQVVGFHFKFDDVAMRAAAETMIKPLGFVNRKRRRFFIVKRTARLIFPSLADKFDLRAHHIDNRYAGAQFIQKFLQIRRSHSKRLSQADS